MQKIFPGINLSTAHQRIPVMESNKNEPRKSDACVINLVESGQTVAPMAIAGSDVSIASTSQWGEHCRFPAVVATKGRSFTAPDVCDNTMEAQRATVLLWAQLRRCPYMDIAGASLSHLYGR